MNAIGIICEYNPFHLGHARMLEGLRRQYDAPLVCAMSGNFVQRGDAAVAHKHARGEMPVRCGADLVLELPTPVCRRRCGAADLHRRGVPSGLRQRVR